MGDYSYFDDPDDPAQFEHKNVLYHYPDMYDDWLVIGRFCALARGTRFIMNGANHAMGGFSTYKFNIFGASWEKGFDPTSWTDQSKGNTMVGHDVWIGMDSLIMPGVTIGDGAIVAAASVVTSDISAYCIVGGNPARVIGHRFDEQTIDALLDISWWNWPIDLITKHLDLIRGHDLDALRAVADTLT